MQKSGLFRITFIFILLGLVLTGCGRSKGEDPNLPAMKSQQDTRIVWAFTQDGQKPEQLLIDSIHSAQHTLDIAIYSLTHPDIVKAIKDTHQRGVAVRLITDKSQLAGKSQTEASKILGSAGVPMKVNTHSGLMHLKLTIADGKTITTGSFNYSKAASTRNDEVLILIDDENIAKSFQEHFESLWSDSKKFEKIDSKIAQDPIESASASPPAIEASNPPASSSSVSSASPGACEIPSIKGNINSKGEKIYHVPEGQYYESTKAEEMFCTAQEAELHGYRVASR